jgi:hypothetical protein
VNNLFRYKIGDTVLLGKNGTLIEATIVQKAQGKGKQPSVVKVQSSKALLAFAEPGRFQGDPTPARKDAWLNTKEWEVRALVHRGS